MANNTPNSAAALSDLWSFTPESRTWSVFISDIRGYGAQVQLPSSGGFVAEFKDFVAYRDRENEVTHWSLLRGNVTYTIFND